MHVWLTLGCVRFVRCFKFLLAGVTFASFCLLSALPLAHADNLLNDEFWNKISDKDYGDDSTCDTDCSQVFKNVACACGTLSGCKPNPPSLTCDDAKQDNLYSYCQAYNQAGWSAFFDSYMIVMDTQAAAACWLAFAFPLNAGADLACNALGTLDAAGDIGDQIELNRIMGDAWWGSSTMDKVGTILGAAGLAAGIGSLSHLIWIHK